MPCPPSPRQVGADQGAQGGSCPAVRGLRHLRGLKTPVIGMLPGLGQVAGRAPRGGETGSQALMSLTLAPGKTLGMAPQEVEAVVAEAVVAEAVVVEAVVAEDGTEAVEASSGPGQKAWAHQMSPSGPTMTAVMPIGPQMTIRGHPMTQSGPQVSLNGPQMRVVTTHGPPMTARALLPGQPMTARMKPPSAPGKTQKADQV